MVDLHLRIMTERFNDDTGVSLVLGEPPLERRFGRAARKQIGLSELLSSRAGGGTVETIGEKYGWLSLDRQKLGIIEKRRPRRPARAPVTPGGQAGHQLDQSIPGTTPNCSPVGQWR